MVNGNSNKLSYRKARLKNLGNIRDITFGVPAWQFSCGGDSHESNGNGYGHCKAQGKGHNK